MGWVIFVATSQETIKIKLIDDQFKSETPRFKGFFHGEVLQRRWRRGSEKSKESERNGSEGNQGRREAKEE